MGDRTQLEERVVGWLDEQGYPLEMRVAGALHERDFAVIQSEYYKDPESGDLRELDVVGHMQEDFEGAYFRVSLQIECKRSPDKPWVLFTSDRRRMAPPAAVAQRAANQLGRHFLMQVAKLPSVQELSIFTMSERPGYGITQAFTTGKDVCYAAITSVAKAVTAEIHVSDEIRRLERAMYMRGAAAAPESFFEILLPVLVVEGNLVEAFLDEKGRLVVREVDLGQLAWRKPTEGMPHTLIDIVSWNGFGQYLDQAKVAIERLFELCRTELGAALHRAAKADER